MRSLARLQGMSETVWERHANPWSAWTRVPILPLLALAIWSREWIAAWAFLPVALLILWAWMNPRIFPRPRATSSWSARAVMGERVWLQRGAVPIPRHHACAAALTAALAALGLPPLVWGLWRFEFWPVVFGLVVSLLGKFWFLDRMVWLFDDMARTHPIYRTWLREE